MLYHSNFCIVDPPPLHQVKKFFFLWFPLFLFVLCWGVMASSKTSPDKKYDFLYLFENQTVYYLGIACASLINIFDPEMVVIGGGVANAGEILFKPLRQVVKASIMKHPYRKPLIVRAKLGEDAGLLGAAALVFSHMQRGVGR